MKVNCLNNLLDMGESEAGMGRAGLGRSNHSRKNYIWHFEAYTFQTLTFNCTTLYVRNARQIEFITCYGLAFLFHSMILIVVKHWVFLFQDLFQPFVLLNH